jgi:hypothetical protein
MFAEQAAATALNEALFAYSMQKAANIQPSDRFAHYTSGAAAAQIIGGDANGKRSLWLRNSKLMNDFTEVEWGQTCLGAAFKDWRLHGRFKRVLDAVHPELYQGISTALLSEEKEIGEKAHLLSLAIHNEQECLTGKLSMWRAYGGEGNVCLVFNTSPFMVYQSAYELVLSPVMYGGPAEFAREFQGVIHRLEQRVALLKRIPMETVLLDLKRALDFAVLSTKHIGFHEETEWRVIHQHSELRPDPPHIADPSDGSKRVYQIPLENRPDAGLWGAEIGEALDRVLVGPVKNLNAVPEVIAHWVDILRQAGIANAEQRVVFCGIPLRR